MPPWDGARLTAERVADSAVGATLDVDRHREGFGIEGPVRIEPDGEGVTPIVDHFTHDAPRARGPVAILEHDVHAAQDLLVTEADASQVAGVVLEAQWPRDEGDGHAQPALPTR
jgi:hypothetical protein